MAQFKRISWWVFVALVAVVLMQNIDSVGFQVLFWKPVQMPLVVLLLVSLLIGFGAGWLTRALRHKQALDKKNAPPAS